jgi:hypothetical protein
MIKNILAVLAIFVLTAEVSAGEQMAAVPKYDKVELEKSCYEFIQSLDSLKMAHDYPQAVKNLLAVEPQKQITGLQTLSHVNDLNAIPLVIVFLDSDNIEVKVNAGSALERLVLFDALKRRDKNFPGGIAIKPLGRGDMDLRPLAWIVLRMMRSEDTNLQGYAAIMAGYLGLDYFEDELRILEKSEQPAVSNSAKEALKILANSKEKPQKRDLPYEETEPKGDVLQDEDYKVYSDLLIRLYPDATQKDVFVIRQNTSGERWSLPENEKIIKDQLKQEFGGLLSDEMIGDFLKVNSKLRRLQDKFAKGLNIVLLSGEQEKETMNGGWDMLYKKYPGAKGLMEVSAIAYNGLKTQALVYYGNTPAPMAGAGFYVLMVKQGNRWVIQKKEMCWTN